MLSDINNKSIDFRPLGGKANPSYKLITKLNARCSTLCIKAKNHSKFSLKAHLVFVMKYRKSLLENKAIANQLRLKLVEIASRPNFSIELVEMDKNHIHILVDNEPRISILQIVRRLKQETTSNIGSKITRLMSVQMMVSL